MEELNSSYEPLKNGSRFKVISKTDIKYDESILQNRLKDKYNDILELDMCKVKENMKFIEEILGDELVRVGKPSASKIKKHIELGNLSIQDFKDAFDKTKTSKLIVYLPKNKLL